MYGRASYGRKPYGVLTQPASNLPPTITGSVRSFGAAVTRVALVGITVVGLRTTGTGSNKITEQQEVTLQTRSFGSAATRATAANRLIVGLRSSASGGAGLPLILRVQGVARSAGGGTGRLALTVAGAVTAYLRSSASGVGRSISQNRIVGATRSAGGSSARLALSAVARLYGYVRSAGAALARVGLTGVVTLTARSSGGATTRSTSRNQIVGTTRSAGGSSAHLALSSIAYVYGYVRSAGTALTRVGLTGIVALTARSAGATMARATGRNRIVGATRSAGGSSARLTLSAVSYVYGYVRSAGSTLARVGLTGIVVLTARSSGAATTRSTGRNRIVGATRSSAAGVGRLSLTGGVTALVRSAGSASSRLFITTQNVIRALLRSLGGGWSAPQPTLVVPVPPTPLLGSALPIVAAQPALPVNVLGCAILTMAQTNDLPPIDSYGEAATRGFDYGPILDPGVSITGTPAVTLTTVVGVDATPQARLVPGSVALTTSPKTGAPNATVVFQVWHAQPGVRYRVNALAPTSDGQTLSLWAFLCCPVYPS